MPGLANWVIIKERFANNIRIIERAITKIGDISDSLLF